MLAQLRAALILIGVAVLAYFGIRLKRAESQRDRALDRAREAEGYRHTRKAMDDEEDHHLGDDPAAARVFLAERARADRP